MAEAEEFQDDVWNSSGLVDRRKKLEEKMEALKRAQDEAEEALILEQKGTEEAFAKSRKETKETLERVKKDLEEAQLKITEKDKEIEEKSQNNEDLRKQNEKTAKESRLDKENYDKIFIANEKLVEDLIKLTSMNSQLEKQLNIKDRTNCERQSKLDALQEKFTETEDKLKSEIAKCGEYKTALEKTTANLNEKESRLREAAEIMTEMAKAGDQFNTLKTQYESVVQINLGLDKQVADLKTQLMEKTNEIEVLERATRIGIKSSTKQKKGVPRIKNKHRKKGDKAVPKIKIKLQRKTRNGEHWNNVTPSLIRNDDENQNGNTSINGKILSPSSEPLDQKNQNDDQSPSSSNQNVETESPQRRPALNEVNNSNTLVVATVFQLQKHGIDETKPGHGNFCLCEKKYSSKKTLNKHIRYHTLDLKFPCTICGHRFKQASNLNTHYLRKHKIDVQKSTMINESSAAPTTSTQAISNGTNSPKKIHYLDISKEDLGVFCICGFQSVDRKTLIEHIKQNSDDKKFDCSICYEMFKFLSTLQSHQKDVHNVKCTRPLSGCQHCGKTFLLQKQLPIHFCDPSGAKGTPKRKTRSNAKLISKPTLECLVTPQSSSQHLEIDIEIAKIDPQLEAIKNQNTAAVEHRNDYSKMRLGFYCKCGYKSSARFAKYNLQRHIKYFKAKSHFKCPQCQLSFKSTSRLRSHMFSSHKSGYPFLGCSTCGNLFESIGELRKHKKSELGCSRKRKRIDIIDLTNVPTPAPHREEEYLGESQQQDEQFTTPATLGELAIHKMTKFHSVPNDSTAQSARSTRNQNDYVEPQPSTSKGLPVSTIDRVSVKSLPTKKSSTIISASSHSIIPVDPTSHTDIQHGTDHAKLNAGLFVCICGYGTNNRQKLSSHISYMTLGKRYACPICKMKFVFMSGLRNHTKKSHKKHSSQIGS